MESAENEFYVGDVVEYRKWGRWRNKGYIIGKLGYILRAGKNAGKVRYYYEILFPKPIRYSLFPWACNFYNEILARTEEGVSGIVTMTPAVGEKFRTVCRVSDECELCEDRFICFTNLTKYNNECEHLTAKYTWKKNQWTTKDSKDL